MASLAPEDPKKKDHRRILERREESKLYSSCGTTAWLLLRLQRNEKEPVGEGAEDHVPEPQGGVFDVVSASEASGVLLKQLLLDRPIEEILSSSGDGWQRHRMYPLAC